MTIVYDELRLQAACYLKNERQTTALLHEAYVRLIDQAGVRWQKKALDRPGDERTRRSNADEASTKSQMPD